ncbi:MAG: DUF3604 domain-containing protein [Candidatus Marinimicrobia bacterium]|nr:DUF3604 domain-containing protein [Candidatus Neomarinimicrobiota bacterium]
MSTGAAFFQGPFHYDLSLKVVGARIELTWTEWTYGGEERRCARVVQTGPEADLGTSGPEAKPREWPALIVPGHVVSRSVTAVDGAGIPHLATCVERLVELDGGDVNWHSRIVTANLRGGHWTINGESCIDYAMNPWMAGYAGRRRIPMLTSDPAGGAWVFFEEKLDPRAMNPGPGRLIMRRVGESTEYVLLSGHSEYHVAEQPLPDGRLAVASLTQHDRYEARPPAYELHLVSPNGPLEQRPADLPDNARARPFGGAVRSPQPRPAAGERQLFFGDPHLHSALSGDLEGDQEELYPIARDVAQLDFVAFTENDYAGFTRPLTPAAQRRSQANAEQWNDPGAFTAFQAWEYTLHRTPLRPDALNSHRCVIFPGAAAPMLSWLAVENSAALARLLHGQPVLLHHHHPSGYDITDDTVECNIEVCSGWHNCMENPAFVEKLHALLNAGLRLGFIGGSDNHERNPGLGGALTGVWAKANTRQAIFEALADRRCFATTGPRPDLRFEISGIPMGSRGTVTGTPTLRVAVRNETPIRAIHIIRDGEMVHQQTFDAPEALLEWRDENAAHASHWYYAHIRFIGEVKSLPWNRAPLRGVDAWTSPVWIMPQ